MIDLLPQLFTDYTLRTVALGAATLGLVGGGLGSYAVLRGQSLLGDTIAHAALPGIALAFLLTGTKAPLALLIGAAATGIAAGLLILGVTSTTRVPYDSALALTLSVFFGFGLVLLTYIQRHAGAAQAGLDAFLFGQAAALVERDVVIMAVLGGIALLLLLLFWKEFKLLAFDPDFGRSLGLSMRRVDVLMTTLLVVAIVIGLQTVGVVLMSALIVAPGASARQWTDRLGVMVALSAAFGALSGVSGALISGMAPNVPTGPTIVLCMGGIVVLSLLCAPNRGLLGRWWRRWQSSRQLRHERVLLTLYAVAATHEQMDHPHEESTLDAMLQGPSRARPALERLAAQNLVVESSPGEWALTSEGIEEAQRLAADRNLRPLS